MLKIEQNIRVVVSKSLRTWLNDKTNDGPLVPISSTASLFDIDLKTYGCMKEILSKRFPNKKSFFKFMNHFIALGPMPNRGCMTEGEAFILVVEIVVNKILTALNLDKPDTEEDTHESRPTSMKLEVPVERGVNWNEITVRVSLMDDRDTDGNARNKFSAGSTDNESKENRKFCIEDIVKNKTRPVYTWDSLLRCSTASAIERYSEVLHRTYAATREECVEKALAADDYEFPTCKEAARRNLMNDWWTPVECDNGNRMLRFVDP